jgi:hypothetical protein
LVTTTRIQRSPRCSKRRDSSDGEKAKQNDGFEKGWEPKRLRATRQSSEFLSNTSLDLTIFMAKQQKKLDEKERKKESANGDGDDESEDDENEEDENEDDESEDDESSKVEID